MAEKKTSEKDCAAEQMSEAELQRTASVMRAIASAIGGDDDAAHDEVIAFEWPLSDVLSLVPREYWVRDALSSEAAGTQVTVIVEDLFGQLSRGRVTTTIGQLLFGVSPAFVTAEAFNDQTTVALPLPMIVTALDPALFAERTTKESRSYRVERVPDLFCQPAPRPLGQRPAAADESKSMDAASPASPKGVEIPKGSRLPGVRAFGAPPESLLDKLSAARATAAGANETAAPPHAAAFTLGAAPRESVAGADKAKADVELTPAATGMEKESPSVEFQVSLYDVLNLIPRKYLVTTIPPPETKGQNVRVIVTDVVRQLGSGRVAIPLSDLLAEVPREYVQAAALNDTSPMALPLRAVVNSFDPSLFKRFTTQTERAYRTQGIPDFFLRLPLQRDAWPSASEPASPSPEAPAPPPEEEPSETADDMERLGGVNLNTAGVEQLLRLDKVTPALADEIVKYRSEHGPFKSVFDLFNVPRVGRKTFRAITGMPYNDNRRHRGRRLVALLNLSPSHVAHLPSLAKALADKPGFVGCVISDKDGLLLAQHGVDRLAETVSAVAPRLMRDAIANMKELGAHNVDSLSIHGEGSLFTVIPAGEVFMTAFHQTARLTGGQLRLISRVAVELQWLVSRRGYVVG